MNSKLNIYDRKWLDVVFESRNKEYGAYELRMTSSHATNKALLSVLLFVLLAIGSYKAYEKFPSKSVENSSIMEDITTVDLMEEVHKEEEKLDEQLLAAIEKPQQIAQDPPAIETVRFPDATVVDSRRVVEEIVSQDELKGNKEPARISLKPVKGGEYIAKGDFGPIKKDGQITGVKNGDEQSAAESDLFITVQVMPEPVGGMKEFIGWVAKNYQYPQAALEQGIQGIIEVNFVVEKDGSLSDIKVKRDVGMQTGEEAIRLLKKAKKWNPGIQNGRPVRVSFTMPIRLNTL